MKRMLWLSCFAIFLGLGVVCSHGTAVAAASCQMNQASLADLIKNYDPPLSSTSTTITVPAGTLTFTCTGLGSGMASHVYVLVSGSSGTYATPFLSGPNSFQLTYNLCPPTASTCNGSTNVWNLTPSTNPLSAYEITAVNSPAVNTIPSFLIFVGHQDAYLGNATQYTGSLYFSFRCGEGGNQVAC